MISQMSVILLRKGVAYVLSCLGAGRAHPVQSCLGVGGRVHPVQILSGAGGEGTLTK